jgi:hypothetical protein
VRPVESKLLNRLLRGFEAVLLWRNGRLPPEGRAEILAERAELKSALESAVARRSP